VETQADLGLEIRSLALVDTHEHLLPEEQWAGDNSKLIEQTKQAGEPGWGDDSPDILQDLFLNNVPSDLEVAGATNRQPALAAYSRSDDGKHRPYGLMVLQIENDLIAAIVGFPDPWLFEQCGLPSEL